MREEKLLDPASTLTAGGWGLLTWADTGVALADDGLQGTEGQSRRSEQVTAEGHRRSQKKVTAEGHSSTESGGPHRSLPGPGSSLGPVSDREPPGLQEQLPASAEDQLDPNWARFWSSIDIDPTFNPSCL